jgi:hypothetical protein
MPLIFRLVPEGIAAPPVKLEARIPLASVPASFTKLRRVIFTWFALSRNDAVETANNRE